MNPKIKLLLATVAGCMTLSSCTVLDAFEKAWEFQQNIQENQNEEEESSSSEVEPEIVTENQKKEREIFDDYLDRIFIDMIEDDSFGTHFTLQNPENYGITIEQYVLGNYEELTAEQWEQEWREYEESILELKKIHRELLEEQQQLLYDKLIYNWEMEEKYADIIDYSSYIGGSNGIVFSLACNFYEYTFLEKQDIELYMNFLQDIPNFIDFAIEQTKIQITEDIIPSKYMLQINIDNIDIICSGENNIFIDGFEQKLENVSFLSEEQKEVLLEENKEIVEEKINPAFVTLKEQLEYWYENEAEYKGLYAMEDGQAYYEYLAEYYTGSSMSVNEMYGYLLKKLEIYETALAEILSSDNKTYKLLMEGDYGFSLTDPKEILDSLREYTAESFPAIEDPGYTIDWLPEALQSDGLLAYYVMPQIDTNVKNVIRLNKKSLDTDAAVLYTTLAHEGYPGHLYATNYIEQQNWHPVNNMLNYLGYTEGWAEYTGLRSLYYWDLPGRVAEAFIINEELGYILQAITDIGINYKGWTLEDMSNVWKRYYDIENEEELKHIYDYFVAEPAVILSYPMGYLQIMDLRNNVKAILGNSFEEKEFAEAFLNVGGAPFSIVEEYVMDWVNEKVEQLENDTATKSDKNPANVKAAE